MLATDNALQWDFPGRAVEIPAEEFTKESFQESLATFLEKASMEALGRFGARSSKANISVIETRDTDDPALITQMLMPLLEAVGSPIDVPRFRKRVRDDANIGVAEMPWRRLPLWLVLRVASQCQLCHDLGNEIGRACYKFLICTVLTHLLRDCAGRLAPELIMALNAKLCRRLAKLEMDKGRASSSARLTYDWAFRSIGVVSKNIIEQTTEQVRLAWENFKISITRPIRTLCSRADDQTLRLSLPLSKAHLNNLITASEMQSRGAPALQHAYPPVEGTLGQVTLFTDRYFKLARIESDIVQNPKPAPGSAIDCEAHCLELSRCIGDLFTRVGDAYKSNPEEMSLFILNVFDLWVKMDESAATACPLLLDYAPVFKPEVLDVLHLPTLSNMQRLQSIQSYLVGRHTNCKFEKRSIFSQIDHNCFATRYSRESDQFRKLQEKIDSDSSRARHSKEQEWNRACENYHDLSQKIENGICICTVNKDGSRNIRGCTKCWHWRCRNRMHISIHEDYLPDDSANAAAVVFELQVPSFFAAYRNATFRILIDLGYPGKPPTSSPVKLLRDYTQLNPYMRLIPDGVLLASAKKSFLQTHFKAIKMKVSLSKITLPLGLDFAYYDTKSGVWLKDLSMPLTFRHLCGIHIPRSLDRIIPSPRHPTPVMEGPQSYDIVASQSRCPSDTSIHEFTGYQRLLSGGSIRWLTMLVELGASNLNYSTEDTMHLFSHLTIQAGPARNDECLRQIHIVFRDEHFCERLAEQIGKRLRMIGDNWREVHCMELLITLSLRLFSLAPGKHRQSAEQLLKSARELTLQWTARLRKEIMTAGEADAAERAATYALWASLLCRRTFTSFIESESKIDEEALCSFVQASVTLQQNLVVDPTKLPPVLKNMLVRDVKMAYSIRPALEESIVAHPDSLGAAINKTWTDSSDSTGRVFSPWRFLSSPSDRWLESVVSRATNPYYVPQVTHYNFIEGHLLLDGKPMGRLPLEIRNSEDVKELFGNQHLLTFPSSLNGMSHVLATHISGNELHFGLRGDRVVIQALFQNDVLEYIPRGVFANDEYTDLPLDLVQNCVHWLNYRTKLLEIRRKPFVWRTRPRDWNLNIVTCRAQRGNVFLVDLHSELFRSVAGIFRHFEDPRRLTVFQPTLGSLSVEMQHLELSFYVNGNGLLQCRELHEEIDPNQDAGTLYGFRSAIVLRSVANPGRRSIIAPLGSLTYKRNGMHVTVRASSTNEYGRFVIDEALGRLSCPPEPRLLYAKAQFHAFTSFVLPDPLTGRTGTEEALHTLRSGQCQPWTPLGDIPISVLRRIQALSPRREYYPKDQRRLQSVIWDDQLPLTIQHDSYEALVQGILIKSDRLKAFTTQDDARIASTTRSPSYLRRRGEVRRLLYERQASDTEVHATGRDRTYKSRDREITLSQATNVYQTVSLLRRQPSGVYSKKRLEDILQSWSIVGSFTTSSDAGGSMSCLSNLIEDDIGPQWGSLLNLSRNTDTQDPYKLVFRLGLLAFGTEPNIDMIRILAAFSCIEELKTLQPPSGSSFLNFKLYESPNLQSLQSLIKADYPISYSSEQSGQRRKALDAESKRLALFLLEQWPSPDVSMKECMSTIIDVNLALNRVSTEWQRLYRNWELSAYVTQAQKVLDKYQCPIDLSGPQNWSIPPHVFCVADRGSVLPVLSCELVRKPGPKSGRIPIKIPDKSSSRGESHPNRANGTSCDTIVPKEAIELGIILNPFVCSDDALRSQYGRDLQKSLDALVHSSSRPKPRSASVDTSTIETDIASAKENIRNQFERIQVQFHSGDDRFQWLQWGGMWPCITAITVLELLRSSSGHDFGCGMKEALILYGVLVADLQRLERLRDAQLKGDQSKLLEEWLNTGHENWNPVEYPDWLLLEIGSNILIRPEQVDVACAIISPASGSNSILQMNMGQGKLIHMHAPFLITLHVLHIQECLTSQ